MTILQTSGVTLTSQNFDRFTSSSEYAVVDFSADWCPPCKAMELAFAELAPQYQERIAFGQVDVDIEVDLADRFGVDSIPHVVLFSKGQVSDVKRGFLGIEKLQNDLERLIGGGTKDLTPIFADGDLWDLDDDSFREVIEETEQAVVLFTGSRPGKTRVTRELASLAEKYRKRVFFALLDSRRCPKARAALDVSRDSMTVVFLHHQRAVDKIVGEVPGLEYRARVENLLGVRR